MRVLSWLEEETLVFNKDSAPWNYLDFVSLCYLISFRYLDIVYLLLSG